MKLLYIPLLIICNLICVDAFAQTQVDSTISTRRNTKHADNMFDGLSGFEFTLSADIFNASSTLFSNNFSSDSSLHLDYFASPRIGLRWNFAQSRKFNFFAGLGYRYTSQGITYNYGAGNSSLTDAVYEFDLEYHDLIASAGLEFLVFGGKNYAAYISTVFEPNFIKQELSAETLTLQENTSGILTYDEYKTRSVGWGVQLGVGTYYRSPIGLLRLGFSLTHAPLSRGAEFRALERNDMDQTRTQQGATIFSGSDYYSIQIGYIF